MSRMSFYNGLLNLTNWLGNVIMPTLAGLFFAGAIYRFSRGMPYQHLSYGGLGALMCSGLLRAMETFASQAGTRKAAPGTRYHPVGFPEMCQKNAHPDP